MVEETKINNELRALRIRLDQINTRLQGIILERADIVKQVAKVKNVHNLSVFQPSREMEILRELNNSNLGSFNLKQIWGIWRGIINANTAIQSKLNIAQAYSNEAQARLNVLSTEYSRMEKQQAKLQKIITRNQIFENVRN